MMQLKYKYVSLSSLRIQNVFTSLSFYFIFKYILNLPGKLIISTPKRDFSQQNQ